MLYRYLSVYNMVQAPTTIISISPRFTFVQFTLLEMVDIINNILYHYLSA